MKKIAYIEIDTHAEIAQDFMDLMQDSQLFSVDYFFSEKIKRQIKRNNGSVFLSDSSLIADQLRKHSYDLVIIGTVHRYFNTFSEIAGKYNTSVIVHNLNFPKISKAALFKSIFKNDFVYRMKLWWKEGLFCANETYSKAKYQLVLDPALRSGKLKFLPLFYTKSFEKAADHRLIIVIPGGVSQKRRDYAKVIEIIYTLEMQIRDGLDLKSKCIEFVFLGKAEGEELKRITDLERSLENINITYFRERVSSEIFGQWMTEADVLWCPVQQETEFFSNREVYGKSKMTGNLGDAIKYGKPAVFPENYTSKHDFIVPQEENVILQFQKLKNSTFNFQKDFSRENIKSEAEILLSQLIST